MRIYYDTEFLEDGRTIDLISIGLVTADGREYYAVNDDAPWARIEKHAWLCENVVPHLPLTGRDRKVQKRKSGNGYMFSVDKRDSRVKPHWVIANEVRDFLHEVTDVELWADYGAYDHVALCQLWGTMIMLPKGIPMWTNDLRQECARLGDPEMPVQAAGQHNALADARHNRDMGEFLIALDGTDGCPGIELDPNPCTCGCEGCRYHCGAHNGTDDPGPVEHTDLYHGEGLRDGTDGGE